jgi:hypothetical protein
MTTTTFIETHELTVEETSGYERSAGFKFYGECTCHNPDGNGDGRQDYLGYTREEIEDAHENHRQVIIKKENER